MRRVIIESPYRGETERNLIYARRALKDSIDRGESPFAGHLLYTQVLDDNDSEERALGMALSLVWSHISSAAIFYCDYGTTSGMGEAMKAYVGFRLPCEIRYIGKNP